MKPSVTVSINAVRAALSPTEYRTAREIMSITGYSQPTVYHVLTMLDYRGQIEWRMRPGGRFDSKEVRIIQLS